MIAGLEGTLEGRGSDFAIVNVNGVSFRVYAPSSTLAALGSIGDRAHLHTCLYMREDNMSLYGFSSIEELRLFEMLIGVSGVGPRIALAMLSVMKPDQLAIALATGNVDVLTQIPGLGKKMASRLVLELKGKLDRGWIGAPAAQVTQANAEVAAALTNLGYTTREAQAAVATLPDSPDLSLEDKIRLALQHFGKG